MSSTAPAMQVPFVDLAWQFETLRNDFHLALDQVGQSGNFILGIQGEKFEKKIQNLLSVRYAVGLNSGSDALLLSMRALGVGAGDEVIIPAQSFVSTLWTVISAQATPVIVDVSNDMNICCEKLADAVTEKTKVIMPVHFAGLPADMSSIMDIAKRYHLQVIEDSAQGFGAQINGQSVGTWGDLGAFSLHPLKTLGALGDAGFLCTDREDLFESLKCLRNHGLEDRDRALLWGINSRLDELQAAFLLAKLQVLDKWQSRVSFLAEIYIRELKNLVRVPLVPEGNVHSFHRLVITTPRRDELKLYLAKRGIETRINYLLPLHMQPCAKSLGYNVGDFPNAEMLAQEALCLPLYPSLTDTAQLSVISTVQNFFKGK